MNSCSTALMIKHEGVLALTVPEQQDNGWGTRSSQELCFVLKDNYTTVFQLTTFVFYNFKDAEMKCTA